MHPAETKKARLKTLVSLLYRPSDANLPRQVFALSRKDAEQLPRLPTIAVISVTGVGRPLAELTGFEHILRLSFADVDFLDPELSKRASATSMYQFNKDHAEAITSFIETLSDVTRTIVVHCEGGFSRSCAIALWLHQKHGYRADVALFLEANRSIWSVLTGRPREQFGVSLQETYPTAKYAIKTKKRKAR